jgi:choline dehydrogenase-like flavoprotein
MFVDARNLPEGYRITRDVCIIGGGAAGLTLGNQLRYAGISAVVLEAGHVNLRRASQQFYTGAGDGEPYYQLHACRFRLLGGSTACWGGWCRPLDPVDFEARGWIKGSGWPFEKKDLDPFYRRAQAICGLGPFDYRPARWRDNATASLLSSAQEGFEDAVFQVHALRFGQVYTGPARASHQFDIVVNAAAVALGTDRTGRRVVAVRAATPERRLIVVHAGVFVLAAGGIENARLLLAARLSGSLLLDTGGTIGRFFADHLHVPVGILRLKNGAAAFYQCHDREGVTVRGAVAPSDRMRRTWGTPTFGATLHNVNDPHDVLSLAQVSKGYAALHHLLQPLTRGRFPDSAFEHTRNVLSNARDVCRGVYTRLAKPPGHAFLIGCRAEQAPHPDSRVTLDPQQDALGTPKARLHWRLSESDLTNIANAQDHLAKLFCDHQVEMFPREGPGGWRRAISGGAHHMGTTRMNRDPAHGVVDEHSRVHGTTNLYVTGSSVFPTGGWAPPTLTIVALAARLADTLVHGNGRA